VAELHKPLTESWDCHVHFAYKDKVEGPRRPTTLEAFVIDMKKAGITRAAGNVWAALSPKDAAALKQANRDTLAAAMESQGFVIPVVMVNPHFPNESIDELKWARDNGIGMAGEICGYLIKHKYKGKGFTRLMEKAGEMDIAVLIHLWEPRQGAALARQFPGTRFIFPHFGARTHTDILEISDLAPFKNAMVDTSGTAVFRTGVPEHAIEALGAERVLFGTDYIIDEPVSTRVRTELACPDSRTLELVMRENLRKVCRIPPSQ
jgi:predicted TIM-barrel fold metal-dependent hydrolase